MVFFHGGGLTSGTGNSTTYNHPKLPSTGVIRVTVNSRLGPIGLQSPTTLFLARGGGCSTETPKHDEVDMEGADYLTTLWAQFAKTGDPSVEGLINWSTYSEENNCYVDLGEVPVATAGLESAYIAPPEYRRLKTRY